MKIIESTTERLVAQDRGIAGYITGGGLIIAGGVMVVLGLGQANVPLWAIGAGLAVAGGVVILFNRSELLQADKTLGTISIMTKGLLGQKSASYDMAAISGVRALQEYHQTTSTTSKSSGGGFSVGTGGVGIGSGSSLQLETTTLLAMADGTTVVIEKITSSVGMGNVLSTQSSDGIGAVLATFLGKPYQLVAPNANPAAIVQAVVGALRGEKAASVAPAPTPLAPPAPQPGNPAAAGFAAPVTPPAEVAKPVDPTNPPPSA